MSCISSLISGSTSSPLLFYFHPIFNLWHLVNPHVCLWCICMKGDSTEFKGMLMSRDLEEAQPLSILNEITWCHGASSCSRVLHVARWPLQHLLWSWQAIREQSHWCCRSSSHSTSPPDNHKEENANQAPALWGWVTASESKVPLTTSPL